ncbi:MAG: hypothetical protein KatS3mg026_1695 [Bacteroidia bacterium]|nr:MAG: hypothetical protein KatS3mg026_1695 [Bacteroidia bacterium]
MRRWIGAVLGLVWAQTPLDALWAERDNPEKAREAVQALEKLLAQKSSDQESVVRLARLYYLLGEQAADKKERLELYDKAFQRCRAGLVEALGLPQGVKDEEIVAKADKAHLPLLYWAAAALARWGKHAPFREKVAARSRIRLYWDRVYALDPTYFHGGAYRFFGGYYALVPAITGEQDVNKSRENFEKAVQVAPYYLETKVLYAEAYAAHPKVSDRKRFRQLLEEVQAAPVGEDPDYAAENRLAKKKAEALLAQEAELFD